MKIDNTLIISALCAAYAAHCAADIVIIGHDVNGIVYAAEIPVDIVLTSFCGISVSSDDIPQKRMRVKPLTKSSKTLFDSFNPFPVCTFAELTEYAKNNCSANRGIAFEEIVCKMYDGIPAPQNCPFWEKGDFEKDGKQFQVKFTNATVIKESHLKMIEKL